MAKDDITSLLAESRRFEPTNSFKKQATLNDNAEYEDLRREALESPDTFWARHADELHWFKKWTKVREWNLPDAKWFVGGKA